MTFDASHKFNVYANAELRGFDQKQWVNPLGEFSFNSLNALADGAASSFVRTPTAQHSVGHVWQGVFAVSDAWYVSQSTRSQYAPGGRGLMVQYGLRIDAERFAPAPALNPQVLSIFGVRTDHVPSAIAPQPMIGLTWNVGEFRQQSGVAVRTETRSRLDAGIRLYRGTASPLSVATVARRTGLADALQQLQCFGAAAPRPDWVAYAQSEALAPTQCLDGTSPALAQTTPPVSLFAPTYSIPQSWRSEVNWTWLFSGQVSGNLSATFVQNIHQADPFDLNFRASPRFALTREAGRPVFVSPNSIDPASGQVATTDSRISEAYAQITEQRSDLASSQRQLTAGLTLRFGTSGFVSAMASTPAKVNATIKGWYSYADSRSEVRGFSGSTGGDPSATFWTRGTTPHHTVQLVWNAQLDRWVSISISGRLSSGTPFTPFVNRDINGDGYANDRAFVFNTATTSDPFLRAGMATLLASGSPQARACLTTQVAMLADHNSCVGPWSVTLGTITVTVGPFRLGLGNRGALTLYVNNALGGLDQALHGTKQLRGWGQQAFVDPVLVNVRGFDPTSQQFRYTVNPRFGSSAAYRELFRPPFRVTVDFRLDIGRNLSSQALTSFVKHGLEDDRVTVDGLKAAMLRSASLMEAGGLSRILQQRDSLALTSAQVAQLRAFAFGLDAQRDSLYADLARTLTSPGVNLHSTEIRDRWNTAIVASVRAAYTTGAGARAVLSEPQLAWLRARHLSNSLEYSPDWLTRTLRTPQLLPR